jgi:exodeoxyribonuclease-3
LPHVLDWLEAWQPDILALQETKLIDDNFPAEEIRAAGYEAVYSGQKTFNGVAILSKFKALDIVTDIPDLEDPQRRIMAATIAGIRVINLYIPNGSTVESDKYQYKLDWLDKVTNFIANELKSHQKIVVVGDYNIAPEDIDVREPEKWVGQVLCTDAERAVFKSWLNLGFKDTFRLFEQDEKSFSWWDYRMMAFRRNRGLRIDHILASNVLAETCQSCIIDKVPRKLERPSDHAPVIAEFRV